MEIIKNKSKNQKLKYLIVALSVALVISMIPLFAAASKVSAVKNLQATSPKNHQIKLTWDNVRNSSYYTVAVKCEGEKYKKGIYKVKTNKRTFKNVPGGYKYTFSVRAVKNEKKSQAKTASIQLKTVLPAPKISGVSHGYKRNDISWKNDPDATGYIVVETDLETNETTKNKCGEGAEKISFCSRTIGKEYSYKVQSYCKENGEKIKSEWSNEVTVVPKKTYIGHAASNRDGKAGDGDGKEVLKSKWVYKSSSTSCYNWTYLFRFKDPDMAEAAADMMEKAIANDNIGYCSNGTRTYGKNACQYLAAEVDYDLSKITTKTGCSCGDIVMLCIRWAGPKVKYTGGALDVVAELKKKNKKFDCYTDAKYVTQQDYLERGDILITAHPNGKNNHVVMVL